MSLKLCWYIYGLKITNNGDGIYSYRRDLPNPQTKSIEFSRKSSRKIVFWHSPKLLAPKETATLAASTNSCTSVRQIPDLWSDMYSKQQLAFADTIFLPLDIRLDRLGLCLPIIETWSALISY